MSHGEPRFLEPRAAPGRSGRAGGTPCQLPEQAEVHGIELLAMLVQPLRRLQDHRDAAETRVVDDETKRFQAEVPPADPRVAIDPAPPLATAVIEVPDPDPVRPDRPSQLLH